MIKLTVCFSEVTPESMELGEFSANGVYDEIDFDHIVEIADYLEKEGIYYPSSSEYHHGIWYSTDWETVDYSKAIERQYSYHLKNAKPNQEKALYKILKLRQVI